MNWDYISGFFDADGSVTLSRMRKGAKRTAVIGFTNNKKEILDQIDDFIFKECGFRGIFYTYKPIKTTHSIGYDLRYTYYPKVTVLISHIKTQHLKKKKRFEIIQQLNLLTPNNGKYTSDQLSKKEKLEKLFFKVL